MKKLVFSVAIIIIVSVLYYYLGLEKNNTQVNNTEVKKLSNNITSLQSEWKIFTDSLNKKRDSKSNTKNKENNIDKETKKWAIQELSAIGSNIAQIEKDIELETDLDKESELYHEYYSIQQEYFNLVREIAPKKHINSELELKRKKYLDIKREFESKGELTDDDKEKLAKIKQEIFNNK